MLSRGSSPVDWQRYPKADVLTLDNALTFPASRKGLGFLSRLLISLLNLRVIPVLLPRGEPLSHGAIDGHNSVFVGKLRQRQTFSSLEELAEAFARLNAQYLASKRPVWEPHTCLPVGLATTPALHCHLSQPQGKRLYFIRCVVEPDGVPCIEVLKLHVSVNPGYLSQFVLA